jgi:7-cyano-7-deazaguanine synthase
MANAILLSGGIDSAALAYWKKPDIAFNINYGQKPAQAERRASIAIAKELGLKLEYIDIDCSSLGSGDLSNNETLEIGPVSEWWPFRNQLLITLGVMKAISLEVTELMIGAVKTDNKHKDGTDKFFHNINRLIEFQEGGIIVCAPAIKLTTNELIIKSKIDTSILGWTHSCHVSDYPCGICNGCKKHLFVKEQSNLY